MWTLEKLFPITKLYSRKRHNGLDPSEEGGGGGEQGVQDSHCAPCKERLTYNHDRLCIISTMQRPIGLRVDAYSSEYEQ